MKLNLKMIHVADVAKAICVTLEKKATRGQVFTLSDTDPLTNGEYVESCISKKSLRVIYLPYWFARLGQISFKILHTITGKTPDIHIRRLKYLYRDAKANSENFFKATGWRPEGHLLERIGITQAKPLPLKDRVLVGK